VPESYVQGPADGAGKKWRTRERTIGANTVHEAYMAPGAMPTYYYNTATTTGAAAAQNKIFIDVFNASGSGRVVRLRKMFVQIHVATVTGVSIQFDLDRTSAVGTGGTTLTATKSDTADENLPAQITARHAPTGGATKSGTTLFATPISTEETMTGAHLSWAWNIIPEGTEVREPTAREGEGLRLIQITSSTAGTISVVAVFTTEPT
jgi:hypothetical protein